jgi:hypothetical protein
MARIRSVAPSLRISETVASWPMPARYAWVLLWGYLDDHGRGLDNARIIATDCFPLDDNIEPSQMNEWLSIYEQADSICRYEFEGKRYLHALNWSDYQKPQHPSKVRIPPCREHESGALKTWSEERNKERMKVSGNPHEGFVTASPTSRGGGEVSLEMSSGVEGGPSSGDSKAPPLFADRCARHGHVAEPGPCGDCKDAREAAKVRTLHAVPSPLRRCIVHDTSFERVCNGCEADRKAAESA